jgi:hypothetical protein
LEAQVPAGSENFLRLVRSAVEGELKLPAFQREFKWSRSQVVLLYDSIRQGYPLGSVILLEGSRKELQARSLRGARTQAQDADTKRLVLDGQQRITAGIDLFFNETTESNAQYFIDIDKLEEVFRLEKVDLDDDESILHFLAELDSESGYCQGRTRVADPYAMLVKRSLLSTALLRPDNSKDRDFYLEKYEEHRPDRKKLIRNVIKPYLVVNNSPDVPYVTIDSSMQLDAISRIFATLNSTGKVLTPFELVVAVLFPDKVDLREEIAELKSMFPYYRNMDPTGEIALQTVVMLEGKNHKKSLLPKNLSASAWKERSIAACERLNEVGVFLTEQLGMALDLGPKLIPYDSVFAPLAVIFTKVQPEQLSPGDSANFNNKLLKWVVGASLRQRYQEGVHNKQAVDVEELLSWIGKNDDAYEPAWLKETTIPSLRLVTPNGAIGNIVRSLLNRKSMQDPLTGASVNVGRPQTELHHIFPTKYVSKLKGWNTEKGDRSNLVLNTMQLASPTNIKYLNDDPSQQIAGAAMHVTEAVVSDRYAQQGIPADCVDILRKPGKTREDYWNFIKLRETEIEKELTKLGFTPGSGEEIDDSEEA